MKMEMKMERYKGDAKRPGIETDMIYLGTTLLLWITYLLFI